MGWLRDGFITPARAELSTGHHLRPIRADDVDIDFPAVMGSRERLWSQYGEAWGWPPADMTPEQDRNDLDHHEREIAARETFNYAVLNAEETELLGCLYIDPPYAERPPQTDAVVSWWVVDAALGTPLEATLRSFVPGWLAETWGFRYVHYWPLGERAELASRALAWTYHEPERLGATKEPWAHGTIYRHPEFPNYSDLNSIRVREAPTMTAPELYALAERELGRYFHRRIHFDSAAFAAPHRKYFAGRGFMTVGLTLMHFEGRRPAGPDPAVREVEFDTVAPLRVRWHHEDFGEDDDPTAFHAEGRKVRMRLGARTLAVFDGAQPIAFAGLDLGDDELEIAGLYVVPEHRGHGLGTALTQSAIAGAGTEHVWICAEEAGRAQHLYARLGFRPVLTTEMFLRLLPQAD